MDRETRIAWLSTTTNDRAIEVNSRTRMRAYREATRDAAT